MNVQLDAVSHATVGRFGLKLCVSVFIAAMGKTNFVMAASGWLALYAIFTSVITTAFRERFPADYFSHWDEALWLITVSVGIRLARQVLA
ncbi:hypothetical protein [Phyllobacterium bourgognense]|uniref:Uncharacterized protein n=1 Tax=Phyllobacterium bourgognense TaxID=314236 RepID=A0A368YF61_9HYPH|nr:hypothetical protein [Phyllobacterium bourgognense]RCW78881.1 hypothetical protein C7476_12167 [Phyllobacterium bourgognense]